MGLKIVNFFANFDEFLKWDSIQSIIIIHQRGLFLEKIFWNWYFLFNMAHCVHWSCLSPIFKASSHLFEIETHFSVDVRRRSRHWRKNTEENKMACFSSLSFWWDHFCQWKDLVGWNYFILKIHPKFKSRFFTVLEFVMKVRFARDWRMFKLL